MDSLHHRMDLMRREVRFRRTRHHHFNGPGSAEEARYRNAPEDIFTRPGADNAKRTITGDLALNLIRQTRLNIQGRLYNRSTQRSSDCDTYSGMRKCPTWDGKGPGRTLRQWLREQFFWQMSTPSVPEQ